MQTPHNIIPFNLALDQALKKTPTILLDGLRIELLSFHKTALKKFTAIREHQHPNYEVAFCDSGELQYTIDDIKVSCSPKNKAVFFLPPAVLHRKLHGAGRFNTTSGMILRITGENSAMQERIKSLPEYLKKHNYLFRMTPPMTALKKEIERQACDPAVLKTEIIASLTNALLILFFQKNLPFLFDPAQASVPANPEERDRICRIKRQVLISLNAGTTMEEFAAMFSMSKRHLNRIFKQETGSSFMHYYLDQKLKHALNLLADTELPVAEIAQSLHFRSSSYFAAFLRARCGCSPMEYRQKFQAEQ